MQSSPDEKWRKRHARLCRLHPEYAVKHSLEGGLDVVLTFTNKKDR